ncbi:MAG: gliding motility-associated C-terminal domain-containing protein [Lewinella sp.]|nr:gliding motility-associated C-terminal domain-containing protein [Lewinella sp.]
MRFAKAILLLCCIWTSQSTVSAQILPPDFQCVTNDTLIWAPATNPCGPFTSLTIFASQDPAGPYSELTTITDESVTSFFHAGANNQTWYYYLVSEHACANPTSPPSDTLDNLIPLAGPIEYVTVIDGEVQISWEASPSPETSGYAISRNTTSGTTIIDTVDDGTSYTDTGAAPDEEPQTYFVTAVDLCGNESLVITPHTTIFLETTPPSSCDPTINLSFNAYDGWDEGVDRYEIYLNRDGGDYALLEAIPGNSTSFAFDDGNDGETICFYVEAVAAGTGFRSRSNISCQTVSIVQPIRDIYALGADVLTDGTTTIDWQWDPAAALTAAQLQAQAGTSGTQTTDLVLTFPLSAGNSFTDAMANAQGNAYTYRLRATDECGNTVLSNPSTTLFLSGQAPGDGFNYLNWEAYSHDFGQVLSYELVKVSGMGEQIVFTGSEVDLNYKDVVDLDSEEASGLCYYLRAEVRFTLPDGQEIEQELHSNTLCLEQQAKVYVPNVFAPEGVNSVFRPLVGFGTAQVYLMQIYDRWGGLVFESRNLSDGWNGRKHGDPMPQGIYLYYIELTQSDGTVLKLSGDVMLLR